MRGKLSEAAKEKIKDRIIKILHDMDLLSGIIIYCNGKRYRKGFGSGPFEVDEAKASDYVPYANDRTITVVYDGAPFYDIINGHFGWEMLNEFDRKINELLKPYEMYYEPCTSWAFSLAE